MIGLANILTIYLFKMCVGKKRKEKRLSTTTLAMEHGKLRRTDGAICQVCLAEIVNLQTNLMANLHIARVSNSTVING